jgi:hypothetical protein
METNIKSEIHKVIQNWLDNHEFVAQMRQYEIDTAINNLVEDIMEYVE